MADATEIKLKMSDIRTVAMGLICSQSFCARIVPMIQLEAFKDSWVRKIIEWSVDYFNKYKKPIYMQIEQEFQSHMRELDEDEGELIGAFLENTSKEYDRVKQCFNDVYYINKAINFFRKAQLEALVQKIETAIETGNFDEGYAVAASAKQILAETTSVSRLYNHLEDDTWFDEERNKALLRVDGAIGALLGNMDRGQLIAFLAPMKRGKTWFLLWLAYEAMVRGLKVLYVTHEMQEKEVKQRMYSMITKRSWNRAEHILVPMFDCKKNTQGACGKRFRTNRAPLGSDTYRPCVACLEKKIEGYEMTSTMIRRAKPVMDRSHFSRKMKSFNFMHGKNFRMQCVTFGMNWPAVRSTIETLAEVEDFIPDIVIEDYINIRAPYKFGMGALTKIEMIDMNWKETKAYAAANGYLWITGHQGTRATVSKAQLKADDTSGFIDIVAHVNKLFGINQTTFEKKQGVTRLSTLANRMEEFSDEEFVTVLQALDIGDVVRDSMWGYDKSFIKNGKRLQSKEE